MGALLGFYICQNKTSSILGPLYGATIPIGIYTLLFLFNTVLVLIFQPSQGMLYDGFTWVILFCLIVQVEFFWVTL